MAMLVPSVEQYVREGEMDNIVIHAKGLTKQFGHEIAVQDVTFEIPRGKIFGFIGPSGSGKTTTIRLLTGVYQPTAGDVIVLGRRPKEFVAATREKIGYMPQFFVLYQDLSVWENLNFAASIYGMRFRRAERLKQLLDFVELSEHKHKLARNISGGMQRRLSLAATLVHNPELIFLDEPTAGVDPVLRRKFWDHFKLTFGGNGQPGGPIFDDSAAHQRILQRPVYGTADALAAGARGFLGITDHVWCRVTAGYHATWSPDQSYLTGWPYCDWDGLISP